MWKRIRDVIIVGFILGACTGGATGSNQGITSSTSPTVTDAHDYPDHIQHFQFSGVLDGIGLPGRVPDSSGRLRDLRLPDGARGPKPTECRPDPPVRSTVGGRPASLPPTRSWASRSSDMPSTPPSRVGAPRYQRV